MCLTRLHHNQDTLPLHLHPSISDLYRQTTNPQSIHLQRYFTLLPQIGPIGCPEKCPDKEKIHLFETSLSYHSAQSRIKDHSANILLGQLYTEVQSNAPEHLHLLPSILSPQTSYPLISLNRSNPHNRLPNWATRIALQRKLRLPVYDPDNTPTCKCGAKLDCWGDHTFKC
jgi:hypothetical protein